MITDAFKLREVKIQQLKREKEIKSKIEVGAFRVVSYPRNHHTLLCEQTIKYRRDRRRGTASSSSDTSLSNDLDLIASLLPSISSTASRTTQDFNNDDDDDDIIEDDDAVREATLLLIRLFYSQSHTKLGQLEMEMQLLRNAPPDEDEEEGKGRREEEGGKEKEDDTWRLDAPVPRGGPDGRGPLLDAHGKVRIRFLSFFLC